MENGILLIYLIISGQCFNFEKENFINRKYINNKFQK